MAAPQAPSRGRRAANATEMPGRSVTAHEIGRAGLNRIRGAGVTFCFDAEALAQQEYDKDLRALARDNVAKGATAVMLARAHPGVFSNLRLASPRDNSRPWLSVRAVMLAVTRRWPAAATAIFALVMLLERAGMWRWQLFYRPVLDYAFWTGVDAELGLPV